MRANAGGYPRNGDVGQAACQGAAVECDTRLTSGAGGVGEHQCAAIEIRAARIRVGRRKSKCTGTILHQARGLYLQRTVVFDYAVDCQVFDSVDEALVLEVRTGQLKLRAPPVMVLGLVAEPALTIAALSRVSVCPLVMVSAMGEEVVPASVSECWVMLPVEALPVSEMLLAGVAAMLLLYSVV